MTVKIVPSMSYHTYAPHQFGFGLVSMIDKRKDIPYGEGKPIFAHKVYENTGREGLTPEQEAEIKADCEALVRLLEKFFHNDEFVEV